MPEIKIFGYYSEEIGKRYPPLQFFYEIIPSL